MREASRAAICLGVILGAAWGALREAGAHHEITQRVGAERYAASDQAIIVVSGGIPGNPRSVIGGASVDYLSAEKDYNTLSLRDLLDARDLYHVHLMHKEHVIATALGRYLVRKNDPWPSSSQRAVKSATAGPKPARTLESSEVRPYSWPCVLVFVDEWVDEKKFGMDRQPGLHDLVPDRLFLPDGRVVPVCVVAAKPQEVLPDMVGDLTFPNMLIGGGYPVLADVQGEERAASLGCLVTDGHLVYALTNRHVAGQPGEELSTLRNGTRVRIGVTSEKQLGRRSFQSVYGEWPGKDVYLNLDIGLVEIDDKRAWTASVNGIGQLGPIADLSDQNISLRLIDCPVRAFGASSGAMSGAISALFYRYKSVGGFEYVADFLVGPRKDDAFSTRPGDSGTVWVLETEDQGAQAAPPRPIAVQWGGHVTVVDGAQRTQSYALATCLSTVCNLLDVDVVRDWRIGITDYWGAVGHYEIANLACQIAQNANLKALMMANLTNVTLDAANITKQGTSGLSKQPFVPLADVPDLVWKIGHFNRGEPEHPNHFADMDRKRPQDNQTLLELCKDHPENVSVDFWRAYYTDVHDASRGLLPFRVWQFYQGMVAALRHGDLTTFVCAAGIVSHYVGDACQPLHISYLFNGDPDKVDPNTGKELGLGVHAAYEDDMVNYHIAEIKQAATTALTNAVPLPTISGGHNAAVAVVALMQTTFDAINPGTIVDRYVNLSGTPKVIADGLWITFGTATSGVIATGSQYLAMLWESAWAEGNGDAIPAAMNTIPQDVLAALYQKRDFMPSHTLDTIAPLLMAEG